MPPFQNLEEAFFYIEGLTNFEKRPPEEIREYRLSRMEKLLAVCGNPHLKIPSVHIAGSKGKGSTAHIISSILIEAGIKTGLYTSPHICSYKERFLVNRSEVDDKIILKLINNIFICIADTVLPVHGAPTTFEILTLLGFLIFEETGCECNVIETGLGGRLDATNLVKPVCSIITPIEMEHMNVLGDTIEKIAAEKGGIIKDGFVFLGKQKDPAKAVLTDICNQKKVPYSSITDYYTDTGRDTFTILFPDNRIVSLHQSPSLPGTAQKENTALASFCSEYILRTLREKSGFDERINWISTAVEKIRIRGRFERFSTGLTDIIIDGAHTKESIRYVTETFNSIYSDYTVCLFGLVEGKDIKSIAKLITKAFAKIVITKPGTFKKSNINELYRVLLEQQENTEIHLEADAQKALEDCLSNSPKAICVTGSFYLAGLISTICKERGYIHV